MPLSIYQVSVPIFVQLLTSLSAVLDKGVAHAEAHKIEPSVLLTMRLYPDMYSLTRQVQQATSHPVRISAALTGTTPLELPNTETTFPELQARIAKTIVFIETIKPEQVDGCEEKNIHLKLGTREVDWKGMQYLLGFALPNFYFHVATAYDILRHNGVEIGKRDYIGNP